VTKGRTAGKEEPFPVKEAYRMKQSADVHWDVHREWADVQVILAGE
jgi:beta-galactosidase beta subunit